MGCCGPRFRENCTSEGTRRRNSLRARFAGVERSRIQGKVLLLDNDTGVLQAFEALFEHTGLEVYTTSSLLDFHSLVAQYDPDLILIDINMAALKGDEIVSAARNRLHASTVVLFSGVSRVHLKELSHA